VKEFVKRYDDRTWAIVCYVCFGVAFVSALLLRAEVQIFVISLLIFIAISILAGWVLYHSDAHRIMNQPDDKLDEREITLRNRAFRLAYIALVAIVSVILVYWYLATDSKKLWLPSSETEIWMTFWGIWWILFTLPDAVCAYITPPQPKDELIEDTHSVA
jgi:Zn-dependent protease with chaperone function